MSIFYSFEFIISSMVFWFRNFSYAGWLAGELIKYSRRPDSIYKNLFGGNRTDWTYDVENIQKYVKIYREMMDFWKNKIDKKIYEINYEDLVKNQGVEIKNLLNFCNLEFEQECLQHHKSKNPIKTVSINQSRHPIYKDSIESNLKYKNFNNLFKDI